MSISLDNQSLDSFNSKLSLSSEDDEVDHHIRAAITLVVTFAKQGIVPLCTAIAHIIRENNRLKHEIKQCNQSDDRLRPIIPETIDISGSCDSIKISDPSSSSIQCISCRSKSAPLCRQSTSRCSPFINTQLNCSSPNDNQYINSVGQCTPRDYFARNDRFNRSNYSLPSNSVFLRKTYKTVSLIRMRNSQCVKNSKASKISTSSEDLTINQNATADSLMNGSSSYCSDEMLSLEESDHGISSFVDELNGDEYLSCFPLSGCQCLVCLQLLLDPEKDFYVFKADGNALLPTGSTVLLKNGKIGSVVYLGHDDVASDFKKAPVGVSVIFSDKTRGFFKLTEVVEMLDNEIEIINISDSNWESSSRFEDEVNYTPGQQFDSYSIENEVEYLKPVKMFNVDKEKNHGCLTSEQWQTDEDILNKEEPETEVVNVTKTDETLFDSIDSGIRLSFSQDSNILAQIKDSMNEINTTEGYYTEKEGNFKITQRTLYNRERESVV